MFIYIYNTDSFTFHPEALTFSDEELQKKRELRKDLSACHYKLGTSGSHTYTTTAKLPEIPDGFVGRGAPVRIVFFNAFLHLAPVNNFEYRQI
jgi:hypothetical protein